MPHLDTRESGGTNLAMSPGMLRSAPVVLGLSLLVGCTDATSSEGTPSLGTSAGSSSMPGTETSASSGVGTGGDDESSGDASDTVDPTVGDSTGGTSDPDTGGPAGPMTCVYASSTFGNALQLLDVIDDPGSPLRLRFNVPGLPAPSAIDSATLRFQGHDLDHPSQEGFIYVNGSAGYDIPASKANEESGSQPDVDVTTSVLEGTNTIEFGPGPLERSYFLVGDVELIVVADVDECDTGGDDTGTGTGDGVQQTIHYSDADYTQRHNWVWRCNGPVDYAFTGGNSKHADDDCGSQYAPDGSAHGTATFHLDGVIEDDYLVEVSAYHTFNRNPNGARIIVDGVVGSVNQRTAMEGESYEATAQWGVAHLSGDVDIVLDSSQGGYASDAVAWIRITPTG